MSTPLRDLGRVTLRDSLRCVRLALWDEEQSRLVSFREAVGKSMLRRSGY